MSNTPNSIGVSLSHYPDFVRHETASLSLGKWPVYGKNRQTIVFSQNSHVEKAPYEEERHIWETFPEVRSPNMP
jgi:hypothetical protein